MLLSLHSIVRREADRMRLHPIAARAVLATGFLLLSGSSTASLLSFTSLAAFDAAIAALSGVETVDFDAVPAGTTFPTGTGTAGITFTYAIAGPSTLQVSDTFGTTSGTNYLGLDNPDTAFYLGDSFTINFGHTVHAVGLYLIAGNDAQAGDMMLSVAGGSVGNSAIADTLVSDGQAFYVGLLETNPALGFTSATVTGVLSGQAFLAFTVDDITFDGASAVPEPGTQGLLLVGLAALFALRRAKYRDASHTDHTPVTRTCRSVFRA
jgi:hypothetical protein